MLAAKEGHVNVIEMLLTEKADPDHEDEDSNTALHFACKAGMSKSAAMLVRSVAPDSVSRQNSEGKSALHLAAGAGLVETTELLLGSGASVTCVDYVVSCLLTSSLTLIILFRETLQPWTVPGTRTGPPTWP